MSNFLIGLNNERSSFKVLQLTKAKFPASSAIRVVKEAITFEHSGYKSAVLCPPFDRQPNFEIWEGIEIYRPERLRRRSYVDRFLGESFFLSPSWIISIFMISLRYKPDVLHIHDIWLGRAAILAAKGKKIVIDLHENMPAAVVEYASGHHGIEKLFRFLFHQRTRIFAYEKSLLKRADLVLSVVDEAKNRIIKEHAEISVEKVINVENLESKRFVTGARSGKASFDKNHFSILYIGGFGPHRGIDTLVKAMVLISQKRPDIKLHLIGAQKSQYLSEILKLIESLKLDHKINVVGWVSSEDVVANIMQADLCCVPHHSNPHTDNTIPHKLYQYMILKKPILVSSSAPLARTIRQSRAGFIFSAGDHVDCSTKILDMASDVNQMSLLGQNGYKYVIQEGHNWENESALNLIKAYDKILKI